MHLGYEVEVAAGGKEAINHLRALDPNIKAIVSSGYSNDPVMADFRSHRFSGSVAKPFDVSQLSSAIRATIEGPES